MNVNKTLSIILIIAGLFCIYFISLPVQTEPFMILTLKEKLSVIDEQFTNLDIRESSSSYTEDKSIIYLCLKDEKGDYYPINTLIYVILHELAHLLNREDFGHTEAFNKIFDKLLCKAASKGIYDPSIPHTSWYCGVDIRGIKMPTCDNDNDNL